MKEMCMCDGCYERAQFKCTSRYILGWLLYVFQLYTSAEKLTISTIASWINVWTHTNKPGANYYTVENESIFVVYQTVLSMSIVRAYTTVNNTHTHAHIFKWATSGICTRWVDVKWGELPMNCVYIIVCQSFSKNTAYFDSLHEILSHCKHMESFSLGIFDESISIWINLIVSSSAICQITNKNVQQM